MPDENFEKDLGKSFPSKARVLNPALLRRYVGLLREDTFCKLREGLRNLQRGTLDPRELLIFSNVEFLSLFPPNLHSGDEGTVLELSVECQNGGRPPLFGSLLAIAPKGSFGDETVWATVAGAEEKGQGGRITLFAELCAELNNQTDSSVLAVLLQHAGRTLIAESPAFYRAYAPAIRVLQSMEEKDMPFQKEIVHGETEHTFEFSADCVLDSSCIFNSEGNNKHLLRNMPCDKFLSVLGAMCGSTSPTEGDTPEPVNVEIEGSEVLVQTTLDRSQCRAVQSAFTRRISIIQGPPGA